VHRGVGEHAHPVPTPHQPRGQPQFWWDRAAAIDRGAVGARSRTDV
jgi:hypothetical protein